MTVKILSKQSTEKNVMQYLLLVTTFLLCMSHTCHTMELPKKIKNEDCLNTQFLIKGVEWDDTSLIQRGIKENGDVNYTFPESNLNLMQIACKEKKYETVKALLSAPHLNLKSYEKETSPAIHLAASRSNQEIIKLLCTTHPELIHMRDENGNTPLHVACCNIDSNVITFLLKKGAHTTATNKEGKTPIAEIFFLSPTIKKYSLYYGTSKIATDLDSNSLHKLIHKKNSLGDTQLHLAQFILPSCIFDQFATFDIYIKFLISNGLSLRSRNKKNKTPLDLVQREYNRLYKTYIKSKKKSQTLYNKLIHQEIVLHSFLRVGLSEKKYALFLYLLQKCYQNSEWQIPRELQGYIATLYYALNIEAIIANKYKYNEKYYKNSIENKAEIRLNLLKSPEPHFL